MGWFWADATPGAAPAAARSPPAGCPMHTAAAPAPKPESSGSCPYPRESGSAAPSSSSGWSLNPLNMMPKSIPQERAPGQSIDLPTERTISSIPKGKDSSEGHWEYPSPQQMYNAMLRKGYTDTPIDAVESMVEVHNFLNEGAWAEIIEWERRFGKGLGEGWKNCQKGEDGSLAGATRGFGADRGVEQPRLVRFTGRPNDMTPKAQMLQVLGWLYPSKFGGPAPFDRHDWFVKRRTGDAETEVRYVIDYYSAPPEPTGEPVFYLDVRPAIDTPSQAVERLMRWSGDVWYRASGAQARA